MKAHERIAIAQRIRDAAVDIVANVGRIVPSEGADGPAALARRGALEIMQTTPLTCAKGVRAPYGIDVWRDGDGKVFSAWWEPFEVVAMKDGARILRELLDDA